MPLQKCTAQRDHTGILAEMYHAEMDHIEVDHADGNGSPLTATPPIGLSGTARWPNSMDFKVKKAIIQNPFVTKVVQSKFGSDFNAVKNAFLICSYTQFFFISINIFQSSLKLMLNPSRFQP